MSLRSTLLAAVVVWTFVSAGTVFGHAGHLYPNWKNAVDDSARQLRFVDQTRYNDALDHARQVWNDVRTVKPQNPLVRAKQSGETATLKVVDVNWVNVDTIGQWFYKSDKPSLVKLNCWWLGPPGTCDRPGHDLSTKNEKIVMAHELGHTLGLDHMMYDQLMDETPISSDSDKVTAPQDHDKLHYHERWD